MKEIRSFIGAGLELRVNGKNGLRGHAALFNVDSHPIQPGNFIETIRAGAFARTLKEGWDVALLYNHEVSQILARKKNNKLQLEEDRLGLAFSATLPDTQLGRDIAELVRRGDLSGMSFQFTARKDEWSADGSRRELIDVDLFEVSIATFPAYPGPAVEVDARSKLKVVGGTPPGFFGIYEFERRKDAGLHIPTTEDEETEMEGRRYLASARLKLLQIEDGD
jgi:hypothetical protein